MPRASRVLHLMSVVFLLPLFAGAQETSANKPAIESAQEKRPRRKIGVALEGGGALGLAHIGVLQWFEDHHIPILKSPKSNARSMARVSVPASNIF